jgi:RNA polymerase sigma factor (sigma-70 family)
MIGAKDAYERYLQDISQYPRISPEREAELSSIIIENANEEQVEAAVDEFVHANLRLVIHCLKDFARFLSSPAIQITRMDLIAEGNIALMSAVRRFDVDFSGPAPRESRVRFSTYACKCIKSRMRRALKLARFIHVPEHHFSYWSEMESLRDRYGEQVSDNVLHEELSVSAEVLDMLKQSERSRTFMLDDIMADSENGGYWQDILPNESTPCPAMETDARDLKRFLEREMAHLPERTRTMLSLVYFSETPPTLRELATVYGVSSERCRQVCAQGLKALRHQLEPRFERVDPRLAASRAA